MDNTDLLVTGHADVTAVLGDARFTVPPAAIPRGTAVTLDLRAANRDPDVFEEPGRFDPDRREHPHLTFGAGRRPCPGGGHALQLAAGVVEAVLHATEGGR